MLGYGMIAYFKMLRSLIIMFFIFTLLSLPSLIIYSSNEGLFGSKDYTKA